MIVRRATVLRTTYEPAPAGAQAARDAVGARGAAPWAVCVVGALAPLFAGCGAPNPRILEASESARGMPSTELGSVMSEQEKIQAILGSVRKSTHVFVHDGIARDGSATADKLQLLLERDPTGVRSAREFIDRIAAPERTDEDPDRVVLAKGDSGEDDSVPARHWYLTRLAELEGRPPPVAPPEEQREAEDHARRLHILDALAIVEHSDLVFVAPPRAAPSKPTNPSKPTRASGPKRKPKRKDYTGVQFADMLRKKWEFLGADIEDLDAFIEEIASDSFASMVRYRVILDDGREEDFGVWLRAQMGARAAEANAGAKASGHEAPAMAPALAQGGAP